MINSSGYYNRDGYGNIVSPDCFRILSPATEVHWAGWRSHLHELYQNGWDVSICEDHMRRRYRVYLKHQKWDVVGIGEFDPHEMRRYISNDHRGIGEPFKAYLNVACKIAHNIHIQDHWEPDWTSPINPIPTVCQEPIRSLKDCKIFATMDLKPEHEIIVKEPTMQEILQMALEKQEPEQERIRAEMIRNSKLKANLRMVINE